MTTVAAAVVVLVMHPVLAEDGTLRLVAADVGGEDVAWTLDGVELARTGDREAALVPVTAGAHELRATSLADGAWQAMARPEGTAAGAAFVPAWSAVHEPAPMQEGERRGIPPLPLTLGLAAAVLLAWPRRLAWPKRRAKGARRPSGRRAQGP